MFRFLLRNRLQCNFFTKDRNFSLTHLQLLHKSISKNLIQEPNPSPSFTASYLINSCGLSPQSALSTAQKITIKTTENADAVVNVLKYYGFADTQIAELIRRFPKLLLLNPDNIIRPKLDFFLADVGVSGNGLTELISSSPDFLMSSLEKRLRPNFHLLITSIFDSNQQLATAVRRTSWLLRANLETNFLPNVRILRHYGVPDRNIAKFATRYPRALTQTTEEFEMAVESIRKLGFDPLSSMFLEGVNVMSGMTTSKWERKMSVYRSLGWSESEISSAFKRQPFFMMVSEKKIRRALDFFATKMYWGPSVLAVNPVLLKLSLEKRVIPRCSVLNVLVSKGEAMKNSSVMFLLISEKDFLDKYVVKYQDQVSDVLQAYYGGGSESEAAQGS